MADTEEAEFVDKIHQVTLNLQHYNHPDTGSVMIKTALVRPY